MQVLLCHWDQLAYMNIQCLVKTELNWSVFVSEFHKRRLRRTEKFVNLRFRVEKPLWVEMKDQIYLFSQTATSMV